MSEKRRGGMEVKPAGSKNEVKSEEKKEKSVALELKFEVERL